MKRSSIYIVTGTVFVVVLISVFVTVRNSGNSNANNSSEQVSIPVTVSPVVWHDFQEEIHAVGTLKAHEVALVSAKIPGTVESVFADIGDPVEAGDVVVQLDRTTYDLVAKQAKAQFEQAEKAYRRASNLFEENVIPHSRLEAAEAAYKTTKEAWAIAVEQLRNTAIRAPITGVVVERNVEVGQSVAPGAPILRIVDQSSLKADVDLPENDFDRISVGTDVVITVDAFPEQEFPGRVTVINPMVDRRTRTFCVRIEVPNPAGKLVDGMFARVRISVAKRSALAVPRDALQRLPGSGTYYVFVVNDNKAMKRVVKAGAVGDQYAEIVDGVAEAEKVVTSGTGRLRSGIAVHVQTDSGMN